MTRWLLCLAVFALLMAPQQCPAPLIYTPGEGWHYEAVGEPAWRQRTAKEQMEFAQAAYDRKDYSLALKAAQRTIKAWGPVSDYALPAQYLIARCYEAKNYDEKAFKAYQQMLDRYPKLANFDEVIQRQFEIANRFLAGKRFRLWGTIPLYRSMDRTITMYEQIIKTGRYSEVAPQAQINIAVAQQRKTALGFLKIPDYPAAAKAYEVAADRYSDRKIGVDALYLLAETYTKQAATAEYDQSVAGQAISTFSDFMTLYPDDQRVPAAQATIDSLKTEQAIGSLKIAQFYEKRGRWKGAQIYYNDVINKDRSSSYADEARQRIESITRQSAE